MAQTDRPGGRSLQESNTFCFPCLPRVLAKFEAPTLDSESNLVFIFAERHGQGGPGGKVRVSFLATSWETPRSSINRTARRVVSRHPAKQIAKAFALPRLRLHKL